MELGPMEHPVFDIDGWLERFPVSANLNAPNAPVVNVSQISSPVHACTLFQARKAVHNLIHWGKQVPIDVFVWSSGEPPRAYLTKIGGRPYRPAGRSWPCDRSGEPLWFVGQFCFADSRDLVGSTPGDILLIFTEKEDYGFRNLQFEWHDIDTDKGDSQEHLPPSHSPFDNLHGHILRTYTYPRGRPIEACSGQWPLIQTDVCYYHSLHRMLRIEGTQIGSAPFWIQTEDMLPGRVIATLSSPCPDPHSAYPWINHPDPLFPANEWPRLEHDKWRLMIGDRGGIYISVDTAGELHYDIQYY